MKFFKKKKALFQIFTNFLLWLTVGAVTALLYGLRANSATERFPIEEITNFIDTKQFFIVCFSGFVLFGIVSLLRHKSKTIENERRVIAFVDFALDEWASAIANFGSLLLACLALGASGWYLPAAIACYAFAYYLKPNEEIG